MGERDLARARFSTLESEPEPSCSLSSWMDSGWGDFDDCLLATDRVTGAKYPSCCLSDASEGVGDGEITLGVPGMGYGYDIFFLFCVCTSAESGSSRVESFDNSANGYQEIEPEEVGTGSSRKVSNSRVGNGSS